MEISNDDNTTVSHGTIYHTIIPPSEENFDNIPIDNLLNNLKCIINTYNIKVLYNQTLETGNYNKSALKELIAAYYYYIAVFKPHSKKVAILGNWMNNLNTDIEFTKAQILYTLYYLSSINLNERRNSEQDLLDRIYT